MSTRIGRPIVLVGFVSRKTTTFGFRVRSKKNNCLYSSDVVVGHRTSRDRPRVAPCTRRTYPYSESVLLRIDLLRPGNCDGVSKVVQWTYGDKEWSLAIPRTVPCTPPRRSRASWINTYTQYARNTHVRLDARARLAAGSLFLVTFIWSHPPHI